MSMKEKTKNLLQKINWKKLRKISLTVLAVIAALLVLAIILLDVIIASSVRTIGSQAVGTEIKLDSFSLNLIKGRAEIKKLSVLNPPSYTHDTAFGITSVVFDLDNSTLLSDPVVIETIYVDGLVINYDQRLDGRNNLADIQKNIENFIGAQQEKEKNSADADSAAPEEEENKPAKKVVIKEFKLTNARFIVSSSSLGGTTAVPLPELTLTDIGSSDGGASFAEAFDEIYTCVIDFAWQNAINAGAKISDLGKDILRTGGKSLSAGADGLKKTGKDAAEGISKSLKRFLK